jgi:hypothetical protein
MEPATASGDITTLILTTESHRREMQKTSGDAGACNEALRRLHEVLARERAALQLHGPAARQHSANIEVLKLEIARIGELAGEHDKSRGFLRGKGRRTLRRGS